jgi:ketosteroid isomerase-like protein
MAEPRDTARVPVKDVENLVDQAIDALNDHDAQAIADLSDPDLEFHSRFASVEGRVYRGKEGLEQYFADIDEAWGEATWELSEIVGWSGDDLVVVIRTYGSGRGSGAPFDVQSHQVWSFRDGRPWRNVVFPTLEEALDAAGPLDAA